MEYDFITNEHKRNTLKNELQNLQAQHWQHARAYQQAESYDVKERAKAALALSPSKQERDNLVTQTTRYLSDDGSRIRVTMGDSVGAQGFFLYDNLGNKAIGIRSDKAFESGFGLDGAALGAYQGRYPFVIAGVTRYLGVYA